MFEIGPRLKSLPEMNAKDLRAKLVIMVLIHAVGFVGLWFACPIPPGEGPAALHAQMLMWSFRAFVPLSLILWSFVILRELRKRRSHH